MLGRRALPDGRLAALGAAPPFSRWVQPPARRAVGWAVALAAGVGGALVALHYHRLGLTLTHYDARGHLIVARRIFDSITPGWQQIGAVWLPLPHLLNAIPVSVDRFYRSGSSGVAISILAFAIASGSIAAIILMLTESVFAAIAGAAVFALNPNVLYLQATPMSEPLLLATTTVAVAMLVEWVRAGSVRLKPDPTKVRLKADAPYEGRPDSANYMYGASGFLTAGALAKAVSRTSVVGVMFALACLTRYEAWPVTFSALAAAALALWRGGTSLRAAVDEVARIALYPMIAIAGFAIFSRVVIGEWLVARGFFVPENKALGDPLMALKEIGWGLRTASGPMLVAIAVAGTVLAAVVGLVSRRRAVWLIPVSLLAMAAIPWTAFLDGHPFRLRYVIPLISLQAVAAGVLAGSIRRASVAGAMLLTLAVAYELRPLDATAPMVVEAQWDRPNLSERARVTACLGSPGSGEKIMASMGSLGHYMQEASADGFQIRDFLHEGNGDIWLAALEGPYPFAAWILIEEKAEGGDMLARIARERPTFLDGYVKVCDGAGLALYRRTSKTATSE